MLLRLLVGLRTLGGLPLRGEGVHLRPELPGELLEAGEVAVQIAGLGCDASKIVRWVDQEIGAVDNADLGDPGGSIGHGISRTIDIANFEAAKATGEGNLMLIAEMVADS